jgi:hypothetical protein
MCYLGGSTCRKKPRPGKDSDLETFLSSSNEKSGRALLLEKASIPGPDPGNVLVIICYNTKTTGLFKAVNKPGLMPYNAQSRALAVHLKFVVLIP